MHTKTALLALQLKSLAEEGLSRGKEEPIFRSLLEITDKILVTSQSETTMLDHIYQSIIRKLAQEYFRIFYVNIQTDSYLIYDPFDPNADFDVEHEASDFFLQSSRDMFDTLYEDDVETFFSAFQKEKIVQAIQDHGEFSLIYRVKHQGGYNFVNMKGTKLDGDEDHIIVGVKNIDADVKREKEYLINLAQARDEANRDGLTGIRNRHAYLEYVAEFERQIACGEIMTYAIVVFDLNGLKSINDTLGHQAGDRYIKEGCNIICNVFKRSPVFRIGGDEFVAIAKGDDYNNLEHLIDQVAYINEQNAAHGGIVIATGMARAHKDEEIRSVFERADARMYENKKKLKEKK